jgi:hypothetical protein
LQQPDLRDDPSQMPAVETRSRPRIRKPLRRQRNPSRFIRRHFNLQVRSQLIAKRLILTANDLCKF